jgi:outer membrane protein assembly factor BamE
VGCRYNGLIITFTPGASGRATFAMSVLFNYFYRVLRSAAPAAGSAAMCLSAAVLLSACGTFNSASNSVASIVSPYKVEVVQGNFVSKEQVEALRPGMSRAQIRDILGSPLVTSVFHADRWDYVFTIRRQGIEAQSRKLAVFFKGEDFDKAEGDTMPSEADFVATLDSRRNLGKVPNLEASPEQLNKPASGNAAPNPAAPPAPAAPVSYPPLEPAR